MAMGVPQSATAAALSRAGKTAVTAANPLLGMLMQYGLPVLGQTLGMIGNVIGSRRSELSKNSEKMLGPLEGNLKQGITMGDIAGVTPLAVRGALPRINAVAGQFSNKFGRSGYARGAGIAEVAKASAGSAADLASMRLQNNQGNLRTIYDKRFQAALG